MKDAEQILYENDQWLVFSDGIEFKDARGNGYFIERTWFSEKTERAVSEYYDWVLHMEGKPWCNMPLFLDAFCKAIILTAVDEDDFLEFRTLENSFYKAGAKVTPIEIALIKAASGECDETAEMVKSGNISAYRPFIDAQNRSRDIEEKLTRCYVRDHVTANGVGHGVFIGDEEKPVFYSLSAGEGNENRTVLAFNCSRREMNEILDAIARAVHWNRSISSRASWWDKITECSHEQVQ